jgi:hypothetical protein
MESHFDKIISKMSFLERGQIFLRGQILWPVWLDYLEKNW